MQDFHYTPPEPLVIQLDPPLKTDKGVLSEMTLGEPTMNQVLFAERNLTEKNGASSMRKYQRALIAKMAGVPEAALDGMQMRAFMQAARHVQSFVDANLTDVFEGSLSITVSFDPPRSYGTHQIALLTATEPTLGMMVKADTALRDMTAERVRMFQENLVDQISDGPTGLAGALPISILNRLATFAMGFSAAGPATPTY